MEQRQILEHDIGHAAIGGRIGSPHLCADERIGRLRLIARVPAPGDAGHVHRIAVGPHAPDAADCPFAEPNGEGCIVEIFRSGDRRPEVAREIWTGAMSG